MRINKTIYKDDIQLLKGPREDVLPLHSLQRAGSGMSICESTDQQNYQLAKFAS
jgi:hypothetical protein